MQTLCALEHLDYDLTRTHDYAQLFTAIAKLDLGEPALVQAFRRMVFNVLAANHDDHTTNVAFLMDREGTWSLAPAYDLTFAHDPTNHWLRAHLMGVGGKFEDITAGDMLRLADRFAIPYAKSAISEIGDVIASWSQFTQLAGMSIADRDLVGAQLLALRA